MRLNVNNVLEGCPGGCREHDVKVKTAGVLSSADKLESLVVSVWCEHWRVCKLRKGAENGEGR